MGWLLADTRGVRDVMVTIAVGESPGRRTTPDARDVRMEGSVTTEVRSVIV